MQHKKEDRRSDEKQDQGVAIQPIAKLGKTRGFEIFVHGKRPDITETSTVEVARMGMVDGVLPLPMVVGREAKHSSDEAPNLIGFARSKEGIVGAVVKNNEDAKQQPARQDGQRNCQPIGNCRSQIHHAPQKEVTAY